MGTTAEINTLMQQGSALHAAGQPEQALLCFEAALVLLPSDANTASACAAVLTELARPLAAYKVLLTVQSALMARADGAANLAIAAEACGDMVQAASAYQHALSQDADHVRSLTNVGLQAASQLHWDTAVRNAKKCVLLAPRDLGHHTNLADFLTAAKCYDEALAAIENGYPHFPNSAALNARKIAVLAFKGDIAASQSMMDALNVDQQKTLSELLARFSNAVDADNKLLPSPPQIDDALRLFMAQTFDALGVCDWSQTAALTTALSQAAAQTATSAPQQDWRDAQFYGDLLALPEHEVAQLQNAADTALRAHTLADAKTKLPLFVQKKLTTKRNDGRIHVGLAVKSLRDVQYLQALKTQLACYDNSRFAMHVYASTRQPNIDSLDALRPYAATVIETAHMTHAEAAGRMRLDQLDIFVDTAFNSAWCRPEILALRVAPVQLRQFAGHRFQAKQLCDYTVSDAFVHPDGLDLAAYGAVVRLPHTCWLANDALPAKNSHPTRASASMPDGALVLCTLAHASHVDQQSFALWMKILRSLPDAVLWLPAYGVEAAANLVREAEAQGVAASKLLFAMPMSYDDLLACMRHADLYLAPLRCGQADGLVDALRLGLPAISCAGSSMAARIGGSVLHAAGLPQCIVQTPDDYVQLAITWGHQPESFAQIRNQFDAKKAPLFDLNSRTREWEAAWEVMVDRTRRGLPPVAFDIPSNAL